MSKKLILSKLSLSEVHLECCAQFWASQYERDMELLEQVQGRATDLIKGPEYLINDDGLRDLGLFSLEKRQLKGDLINVCKYLKEGCQEDETRLFLVVPSNRTRGKRQKLRHRKFHLNSRNNLSAVQMTEHWNRLPREVVECPSPDIFKNCLDAICAMCSRMTLIEQGGWTR
ncbi:hypothetical protein WISP_141788 [Willisornis vidua]|uniref:Uncharacterized protein n=1 Tax=Willisornis vidua TaxID=1566151 RepID=A0ABQ9CRX9_9PASS|nr:hypothetical protein WISP_141788 [Willisornis vidua]